MTEFLLGFYFGGFFLLIAPNVITRISRVWEPLVTFGGLIGSYSVYTRWEISWSYVGIVFWPVTVGIHLIIWLYLQFRKPCSNETS